MSVNLDAIGLTGIYAAEAELAATESNITNASNANYSAETATLAVLPGSNGAGAGVEVVGTQRAEAPFLAAQINGVQADQNYNQALSQATSAAENYLTPSSGTNLGTDFQNLIDAYSNLAATPADPTVRTSVIAAATTLANDVGSLNTNLAAAAAGNLAQLGGLVSQVNGLSQQMAALNAEIQAAQPGNAGDAALLDQRDALANQLAGLIGATTDSAGNVTVGGIALVSGANALTLATTGSGSSTGLEVAFAQGSLPVQPTQIGGTIGGVLAAAASLQQLQTNVQNFATAMANAVNGVQQAGFGLDGSTGVPLFLLPTAPGGSITLNPAITPDNLAAAATAAGVPGDGSNAAAVVALASAVGLDSAFPGSTLGQAFNQIAADFGTTVSSASNNQQQASSTLSSLQQLKSSITGVSLNDQLSLMIEYQNALEAAGRAVQAASDMTTFLIQELNQ
ncbi:MAG TPA: flagellar hook-associated protein FlgK [Candidatus Binataceae bacterium]|jgi:flagellar hook-associated protein 1 FlgK|nr:flagellar hook-associated protein FlgK [Candidatus Binataceae bacterium]